jgi:dGTPase
MDDMWEAISLREKFEKTGSRRITAKTAFVYSLISDSYRWHFDNSDSSGITIRYRELQLLSDMISGMTDGFAVDMYERIQRHAPR